MSVYRVITYLQGPACGGSEAWDFQVATTSLRSLWTNLKPAYQSRVAALADDWAGIGYRVTRVADDDLTPVLRESYFDFYPLSAPGTWDSAPRDESVKVFFSALGGQPWRTMNMMGFPRDLIVDGNKILSLATWQAAFQSWRAKLLQWPLGWITRVQGPAVTVIGYDVDDDGTVVIKLDGVLPTAPPAPGKFQVLIQGVNGRSEINGTKTVTDYHATTGPTDPTTVRVIGKYGLIPFNEQGSLKVTDYAWVPVGINVPTPDPAVDPASIQATRVGKRQRGRPLTAGRGRASARVRT